MKTLPAILIATALAAGCASSGGLTKSEEILTRYEPYVGEPVKSFTAFRPQSWQPISRTQLILWTGVNEAYLLTVANGCQDLQFKDAVRVTSTGNSISTFEKVIVGRDRCPITEIQPIDVRRMKADRNA